MGIFPKPYTTPPDSILSDVDTTAHSHPEHTPESIAALVTLCGVPCIPVGATTGASVDLYHINLVDLRNFGKLKRTAPAISAALGRQAAIGDSLCAHFALAVSRSERTVVSLKTAICTSTFNAVESPVAAVIGADTTGDKVAFNLADMPHLLIAGATGSGKTVCLHTIITSMLFKGTPLDLQFVMIDPKRIELTMYNGLPHLMRPVITEVPSAIAVLNELCTEMDKRYKQIHRGEASFPRIVVVIDELADLMLTSRKAVESAIVRIAQLGRAAGIHLIVATQRPDVKVVTSHIRDNLPARIALAMAPGTGSRVVGVPGADKLSGKGDALFQGPDHTKPPTRLQCAYTSSEDTAAVVAYWKSRECRK